MSTISIANVPLSTTSANPTPTTSLQIYFKERQADVLQLNKALKSGDLADAQQAYNNLVALGNNVIHRDNPFFAPNRALDFNAIGGALQNGDLHGARQAFAALQATFRQQKLPPSANPGTNPGGTPATAVNLSNSSSDIVQGLSQASGSKAASTSGVNVIA